jgi:DnaA family protein
MIGSQLPLPVQLREAATFDSYYAGPNATAVQALAALSGPVLIYGPPGSGRTHLLQAASRAHRAAYLPLRELAPLGIGVLDGLAAAAGACIDDVDAIAADGAWCVALLRLIDALRARNAPLALSAAAPAARLEMVLPDLQTRLSACAAFGLATLSDADRRGLLQERARARGLSMPDEVARWLVNTQPRAIDQLLGALDRLDRASLSAKRRLTLPFAQEVLGTR